MKILKLFQTQSLRVKLILAFLAVALLPLLVTSLYGNWTTSQTLEQAAIEADLADLRLRAEQIEAYLADVRGNLLFLSQSELLQATIELDDVSEVERQRLEAEFVRFVATHPDTFQIRYLDGSGNEIVRVESTGDEIGTISTGRLQNKGGRYYFVETMGLVLGDVFVSPVDLNREMGEVQRPFTPTIRYATPLFRQDDTPAGILVFNLYADPFLDIAHQDEQEASSTLALVDENGFYLSHPDPAREWGSPADLDTGSSAKSDFPQAWNASKTETTGVLLPEYKNWGVALLDRLLPPGLLPGMSSAEESVLVYQTVWLGEQSAPRWQLIRATPRVNLFASVAQFRITALLILALTTVVSIMAAVALARSLAAPILRLTEEVRRFGATHIHQSLPAEQNGLQHDEIGELTAVFGQMSSALDQYLNQLVLLNRAGHHITARLAQADVLVAVETAVKRLLPFEYLSITLEGAVVHTWGDAAWTKQHDSEDVQPILMSAIKDTEWRTSGLVASDSAPTGYLCCAPLCVSAKVGLIELYGTNMQLATAVSGELLSTLAVHASIALDNAGLYTQLADRGAELQHLLERLINAQEEERRMVAFDIHDGLIQMLVGARLQLNNFIADRNSVPERAEAALQKGGAVLADAIVEARRVIEGLRPAALDDLGLVTTIRHLAEETGVMSGFEVAVVADLRNGRLPIALETTAFRIMQEAINNVHKYAQTPRLRVGMHQENGDLHLKVQDWGQGFDPNQLNNGRGVGLMSMRERATLIGGECEITSHPGQGTTVYARLPIKEIGD